MKLSRGRRKKAQEGKYAGGGAVFGYIAKRSQKVLELDEHKAEIVRRVFTIRFEHPQFSLSVIANTLNLEGYTTTRGKQFGKSQIKRILDHEQFYKGIYSYGQITAQGQHISIL
jgi:DNA invertase Pin-like site-specific DNA recombinase